MLYLIKKEHLQGSEQLEEGEKQKKKMFATRQVQQMGNKRENYFNLNAYSYVSLLFLYYLVKLLCIYCSFFRLLKHNHYILDVYNFFSFMSVSLGRKITFSRCILHLDFNEIMH
jgi:hypothetical protein